MNLRTSLITILVLAALLAAVRLLALPAMGAALVDEPGQAPADAAVVLDTGVDYYPRLMEAAAQYRAGHVPVVVVNGNRKSDALRKLEHLGFEPAAPWDEDSKRMLQVLGVPREKVISISAENVFDTISEARAIAPELWDRGFRKLLIVTSPFHTRRAGHIWRHRLDYDFAVATAPAREDPFDPRGWWRSGRQIRQLMTEYGGWLFYLWSWWMERSTA